MENNEEKIIFGKNVAKPSTTSKESELFSFNNSNSTVSAQPVEAKSPKEQKEQQDLSKGYSLGKFTSKKVVATNNNYLSNTNLMIMIAIILLFLLVTTDSRSKSAGNSYKRTTDIYKSYAKYVDKKASLPDKEKATHLKEIEYRLKNVAIADAAQDKLSSKKELGVLMLLDLDKKSPLYKFCVERLKEK